MSADTGSPDDPRDKKGGFFRRFFGGSQPVTAPEPATTIPPPPEKEAGPDLAPAPAEAFNPPDPEPAPGAVLDRVVEPAPPAPQPEPALPSTEAGGGWLSRLRKGLSRSSSSLSQGLTGIFTKRRLELSTVEDLEDLLIQADLGVTTALKIVDTVRGGRFERGIGAEDVQGIIATEVERVLTPVAQPLVIPRSGKPFVVLVVGVNGSGKTTTIGKLAAKLKGEGRSVMLAAGDTFRAAAVEQLKVWGSRIGAPVVARDTGADAAGLAFDALQDAAQTKTDVLLIDTAGRLQNRAELMDELAKILRVIRKQEPDAPHAVLLVLDATVGQNAMSQVEIFGRVAGVTGLVMTKLDGTARGGILIAIAEKYRLPVHFVGVGESVEDLEPFTARDFARAIAGLER